MSKNNEGLTQDEIVRIPGKLMMFFRLSQFLGEKRAHIHNDYKNVILFDSFLSNSFSIGRDEDTMEPFIGIQDKFIPWFLEANWVKAYLCPEEQYLYLVSEDGFNKGLIIGIKIRRKRMSLLWSNNIKNERYLLVRIFKILNKEEYQISNKIYATISLESIKNLKEKVPNDYFEENEKELSDDDEFKKVDLWS